MAKLNADLLDDLTIKAAKPREKEYTLRDGNGLFLLIHPNGGKYFHLRTTLHGKPKKIQLKQWQPWKHSTGARTAEGKARSSRNAFTGGLMQNIRSLGKQLNSLMREQKQRLKDI